MTIQKGQKKDRPKTTIEYDDLDNLRSPRIFQVSLGTGGYALSILRTALPTDDEQPGDGGDRCYFDGHTSRQYVYVYLTHPEAVEVYDGLRWALFSEESEEKYQNRRALRMALKQVDDALSELRDKATEKLRSERSHVLGRKTFDPTLAPRVNADEELKTLAADVAVLLKSEAEFETFVRELRGRHGAP